MPRHHERSGPSGIRLILIGILAGSTIVSGCRTKRDAGAIDTSVAAGEVDPLPSSSSPPDTSGLRSSNVPLTLPPGSSYAPLPRVIVVPGPSAAPYTPPPSTYDVQPAPAPIPSRSPIIMSDEVQRARTRPDSVGS